MTYLDYVLLFEKCDQQQPAGFSGNATRLYVKLLAIANLLGNGRGPVESFSKSDPYVAAAAGMVPNTMKKCRDELVAGGLLDGEWGEKGQGKVGLYRLLDGSEKLSKIDSLPDVKLSNSDSLEAGKLSKIDSLEAGKLSNFDSLNPENDEKTVGKLSNFDTLLIEKETTTSSAAVAAGGGASSSEKKTGGRAGKKVGADPGEVAVLPLPHSGPEFAEAWRTFTTTNTKQRGKPLSAFELMLRKLGKYPEGFAVVMLEAAIQGDWSGVENPGTARAFAEWQREQAQRPAPPPAPEAAPAGHGINHAFVAEQQAAAQAARSERFARYAQAGATPQPELATTI